MTKEHNCIQLLPNGKICGETDPSKFHPKRKGTCIECRKRSNNEYNKIKAQNIRDIEKLEKSKEELEVENKKLRYLECSMRSEAEEKLITLSIEAIKFYYKHKDKVISWHIDNLDEKFNILYNQTLEDYEFRIQCLEKELSEIKDELKNKK